MQTGPDHAVGVLGVVGIGGLEPGPRKVEVQVEGVRVGGLKIEAVEDVLLVAMIVVNLELGPIQKPAGVQSVGGNKIPHGFPPKPRSTPPLVVPKVP